MEFNFANYSYENYCYAVTQHMYELLFYSRQKPTVTRPDDPAAFLRKSCDRYDTRQCLFMDSVIHLDEHR